MYYGQPFHVKYHGMMMSKGLVFSSEWDRSFKSWSHTFFFLKEGGHKKIIKKKIWVVTNLTDEVAGVEVFFLIRRNPFQIWKKKMVGPLIIQAQDSGIINMIPRVLTSMYNISIWFRYELCYCEFQSHNLHLNSCTLGIIIIPRAHIKLPMMMFYKFMNLATTTWQHNHILI